MKPQPTITIVNVSSDSDGLGASQKSSGKDRQLKSYLTAKYGDRLQEMDKNMDGVVDRTELLEFVADVVEQETRMKYLKYGIIASLLLFLLFALATFGLVWAVVELSRDTSVNNNVLVAKDTDNPIATRNLHFHSENGVFIDDTSNNGTGSIVATAALHDEIDLTALPALYKDFEENDASFVEYVTILNNLQAITLEGDGNSTSFSVHHISKTTVLTNSSLLLVTTSGDEVLINPDGSMIVNGVAILHDHQHDKRLLFLHESKVARWAGNTASQGTGAAAGWLNNNVIKPVTCLFGKDVCDFIQTLGGEIRKEAEAYFNELKNAPEKTYNAARKYISEMGECASALGIMLAMGPYHYDDYKKEPVLTYCQQFVPCLKILAPIDDKISRTTTSNYWEDTGNRVKRDLEECIKGNYITCFKYKKCIQVIMKITGTMPKPKG